MPGDYTPHIGPLTPLSKEDIKADARLSLARFGPSERGTWTKTTPTAPGWYWTRHKGFVQAAEFTGSRSWWFLRCTRSATSADLVRRGYEWWTLPLHPPTHERPTT